MTEALPPQWEHALRTSPFPTAVADLGSLEVVDANGPALRVFEQREDRRVSVQDGIAIFAGHRDLAALLRSGRLDGFETHVSLGSSAVEPLELRVWVRSAPDHGEDRRYALVIASEDLPAGDLIDVPLQGETSVTTGTIDGDWVISWVTRDATELLGHEPSDLVGAPFLGLVAPDAAADVVAALGHATHERRSAVVGARVRNAAGDWRAVRMIVSPQPGSASGIVFVLAPTRGGEAEPADLARSIQQRIEQLVRDVRVAGLARSTDWTTLPDRLQGVATDLSSRQWEIVIRLRRGERVPDIARAMHLSASTVRNHLTEVFRKFGVRSQSELLATLREDDPEVPPRPG